MLQIIPLERKHPNLIKVLVKDFSMAYLHCYKKTDEDHLTDTQIRK